MKAPGRLTGQMIISHREVEEALCQIYKGEIATADVNIRTRLSMKRGRDLVVGGKEGEGLLVLSLGYLQLFSQ